MCDFLSGWINLKTEEPEIADLCSHSETQRILGWGSSDLECRREWEWTNDDDGASLKVRVLKDDEHEENWWRAVLMARWKTRADAVRECVLMVAKHSSALNLLNCTLPDGLVIPDSVVTLDLRNCTLPDGLVIPDSVVTLNLWNCTLPDGLVIPDSVVTLDLWNCTLPDGLVIPDSVVTLDLRNCALPDGLVIPDSVVTLCAT